MAKIRALIVDDDASARSILQKFLVIDDRVTVVGLADCSSSAMNIIQSNGVDAVFLDINMPEEDGLAFAARLKESGIMPQIVFTTAYSNYAVQAFHLRPIDYLVKPFGFEEVGLAIDKIEEAIGDQLAERGSGLAVPEKIKLRSKEGYFFVNPNDVVLFRSSDLGLCRAVMANGTNIPINSPLNQVYAIVEKIGFIQLTRAVIANVKYIESVDKKNRIVKMISTNTSENVEVTLSKIRQLDSFNIFHLG